MSHSNHPLDFNSADAHTRAGNAARHAGLPVGVQFLSDYIVRNLVDRLDADAIPGAAAEPGVSWTATDVSVGAGTSAFAVSDDLTPPRLTATSALNENDGIQAQETGATGIGEAFALRSGKNLYFKCGFALSDADASDVFLGLAITDTTVLTAPSDYIGFHVADGSGAVNFIAGKDSIAIGDQISQATGVTLTDGVTLESAFNTFEFVVIGTSTVLVYANGAHVATVSSTTQLPDDEQLCRTVAFLAGAAGGKAIAISEFFTAMQR